MLCLAAQDTWIPIIKELFRLSSSSESHEVKVHSAWVIERPNHGEPALINAELLKTHYSVQCESPFSKFGEKYSILFQFQVFNMQLQFTHFSLPTFFRPLSATT
jgi:hypothetical protein